MAWLLVADDDDDLRVQLSEALAEHGFEVKTASDGAEALRMLSEADELPAAMILDLLMPRMSGREVLVGMGRIARARSVPVIVLSALAPEEQDLGGLGVAAAFLKPVATQTLVDAIARARGMAP